MDLIGCLDTLIVLALTTDNRHQKSLTFSRYPCTPRQGIPYLECLFPTSYGPPEQDFLLKHRPLSSGPSWNPPGSPMMLLQSCSKTPSSWTTCA